MIWKRDSPSDHPVCWWLFFWLLALSVSGALAQEGRDRLTVLVEECIDRQFTAEAITSLDRALAAPCPSLQKTLHSSEFNLWIQPHSGSATTLGQLLDLRYLTQESAAADGSRRELDYAKVDAILADTLIRREQVEEPGWWKRFLTWLREKAREEDGVEWSWLENLAESLTPSERTGKFIVYGSLATIVLLAMGILINEIRAIGGFNGRRRKAEHPVKGAESAPGPAHWSLETIRRLSPQQQPTALLNHCIDRLIDAGLLPDARSRTNRELGSYLSAQQHSLGMAFARLAEHAERTLYGDKKADAGEVEACYRDAHALIQAQKPDTA